MLEAIEVAHETEAHGAAVLHDFRELPVYVLQDPRPIRAEALTKQSFNNSLRASARKVYWSL
jgi:hypothetical protein